MADKKSQNQVSTSQCPTNFQDAGATSLLNKTGEPPFKLSLNLNKVEFKCTDDKKPIPVHLKVFNPTNETVCYKVRCTSAEIFRVQPPLGFVKAQETITIIIWYQNQDNKKEALSNKLHYFAIYHTHSDGRTARELWANSKVEGVRRLPATFIMAN
ncbi:unnamed protein product [Caenorhabditis brenneri]